MDANVTGGQTIGALAGWNAGTITASYSTGAVAGVNTSGNPAQNIGGLVGTNLRNGTITASYATGAVDGILDNAGGLVGNLQGSITASYATGAVSGGSDVGGLAGQVFVTGSLTNSYATGPVTGDSPTNIGGLVGASASRATITAIYFDATITGLTDEATGKTTTELQAPTDADAGDAGGIYETWDADRWHFGTGSQYPALKADFRVPDGTRTWEEFGYQLRDRPALTTTGSESAVTLSWTAVTDHWTGRDDPDVEYAALSQRGGDRRERPLALQRHRGPGRRVPPVPGGGGHQRRAEDSRSAPRPASVGVDYDTDDDGLIENHHPGAAGRHLPRPRGPLRRG